MSIVMGDKGIKVKHPKPFSINNKPLEPKVKNDSKEAFRYSPVLPPPDLSSLLSAGMKGLSVYDNLWLDAQTALTIVEWKNFNPSDRVEPIYISEKWFQFFERESLYSRLTCFSENETSLIEKLQAAARKEGKDITKLTPREAVEFACKFFNARFEYDDNLIPDTEKYAADPDYRKKIAALASQVDLLSVEGLLKRGRGVCRHYASAVLTILDILKRANPNLRNTYFTWASSHDHAWVNIFQINRNPAGQIEVMASMIDPTFKDTGGKLGVKFDNSHPKQLIIADLYERIGNLKDAFRYYDELAKNSPDADIRNYAKAKMAGGGVSKALDEICAGYQKYLNYYQNGDEESAKKLLDALIQKYPNRKISFKYLLADLYFSLGKFDKAVTQYSEIISLDPKSGLAQSAYVNLIFCRGMQGAYASAKEKLSQFKNAFPGEGTQAQFLQAKILFLEGELNQALYIYTEIAQKYPGSRMALRSLLEKVQIESGSDENCGDAIQTYLKILADYPRFEGRTRMYSDLADLYYGNGNRAEMLKCCRAVILDPSADYADRTAAEIYIDFVNEDYTQASSKISVFISKFPNCYQISSILRMRDNLNLLAGQNQKTISEFESLLAGPSFSLSTKWAAYNSLVEHYLKLSDYQNARSTIDKYRGQFPPFLDEKIALQKARVLKLMGNSGAEELFGEIIDKSKEVDIITSARLDLVEIQLASGNLSKALKTIQSFKKNHPEAAKVLLLEASAAVVQGKAGKALEIYDRIIHNFPNTPHLLQAQINQAILWGQDKQSLAESTKLLQKLSSNLIDPILKAQVLIRLGINHLNSGNLAAANEIFNKILARYDKLPEYNFLALALKKYSKSYFKNSRDDLEKYIKDYPNAVFTDDVYLYLAKSYLKLGDKKNAAVVLNLLLEKFPDRFSVLEAKRLLKNP